MAAGSAMGAAASANPYAAGLSAVGSALGGANSSGPSTAKSTSAVNVGGLNVPAYPFAYQAGALPLQQQAGAAGAGVSNSTVMLGMLALAALVVLHV